MLSRGTTSVSFDYFKFELEFFAAHDVAEIELPELAGETEAGTSLIQIHNELNTQRAPEICQRNVGAHRFQPNFGIKSKDLSFLYKAIKRVAVEMIAMSRVRRPIGVRIVRRGYENPPARFGNPVELRDESHDVRHMLGNMP